MSNAAEDIIKGLIKQITGADVVDLEVIKVPEGSTLEAEMEKRGYKRDGEPCEGCGNQHAWITPEGTKVFAHGGHDEKETQVSQEKEFKGRRARALQGILRRQAVALQIYDKLKEMEKSIQRDQDEREAGDLFTEILLYADIQQLKERL